MSLDAHKGLDYNWVQWALVEGARAFVRARAAVALFAAVTKKASKVQNLFKDLATYLRRAVLNQGCQYVAMNLL